MHCGNCSFNYFTTQITEKYSRGITEKYSTGITEKYSIEIAEKYSRGMCTVATVEENTLTLCR